MQFFFLDPIRRWTLVLRKWELPQTCHLTPDMWSRIDRERTFYYSHGSRSVCSLMLTWSTQCYLPILWSTCLDLQLPVHLLPCLNCVMSFHLCSWAPLSILWPTVIWLCGWGFFLAAGSGFYLINSICLHFYKPIFWNLKKHCCRFFNPLYNGYSVTHMYSIHIYVHTEIYNMDIWFES